MWVLFMGDAMVVLRGGKESSTDGYVTTQYC